MRRQTNGRGLNDAEATLTARWRQGLATDLQPPCLMHKGHSCVPGWQSGDIYHLKNLPASLQRHILTPLSSSLVSARQIASSHKTLSHTLFTPHQVARRRVGPHLCARYVPLDPHVCPAHARPAVTDPRNQPRCSLEMLHGIPHKPTLSPLPSLIQPTLQAFTYLPPHQFQLSTVIDTCENNPACPHPCCVQQNLRLPRCSGSLLLSPSSCTKPCLQAGIISGGWSP